MTRFAENIVRFENHVRGIGELAGRDLSDYLVYNTFAMECFQAANALIETGEYAVARKKLGFPSTCREVFELLARGGLLKKPDLEKIKRVVFLRNLIAREYQKISERELAEMGSLLEELSAFVSGLKAAFRES